jgi:hypothetical protein
MPCSRITRKKIRQSLSMISRSGPIDRVHFPNDLSPDETREGFSLLIWNLLHKEGYIDDAPYSESSKGTEFSRVTITRAGLDYLKELQADTMRAKIIDMGARIAWLLLGVLLSALSVWLHGMIA